MFDTVLFSKNKISIKQPDLNNDNTLVAFTGLINIHYLGYTLSKDLFSKLSKHDVVYIDKFYENLLSIIKKSIGAHVYYKPFYPGFPEEVMAMSDFELYYNAFIHYISNGKRVPADSGIKKANKKFNEKKFMRVVPVSFYNKYTIISEGTFEDAVNILKNLMGANASIKNEEAGWLLWFLSGDVNIEDYVPKEVPFKENKAVVYGCLFECGKATEKLLKEKLTTATDILRFITFLSGGDVSLSENCKFIKFSRKNRRLLLGLLENCKNIIEDMNRYKDRWLRIGEILHPGEYKQFQRANESFDVIRNNKRIYSFSSMYEEYLEKSDLTAMLELLASRPGEFARRLDHVLRMFSGTEMILKRFSTVAEKVSIPVLMQVITHFKYRNSAHTVRSFIPKGLLSKAYTIGYNLPSLDEDMCEKVVEICKKAVITICSGRPKMGKVYIDEELKNYTIPFAMRSAAKALKTVGRGSKINIKSNENTARLFIWWKNGKYRTYRTDIDLSAMMLDKDWNVVARISYYDLKNDYGVHSGDIVDAPDGASEFIDINLKKVAKLGVRYVVMTVISYTQQPFYDLPECFAGLMFRDSLDSGEVYEPARVENKFDLTGDTKINIPIIFDVENMQMIWMDMALTSFKLINNVDTNKNAVIKTCTALIETPLPSIYDLIYLNAIARGSVTDNKKKADIVFSLDTDGAVTPYDTDLIRSYL